MLAIVPLLSVASIISATSEKGKRIHAPVFPLHVLNRTLFQYVLVFLAKDSIVKSSFF
jgi:hypothetical protein